MNKKAYKHPELISLRNGKSSNIDEMVAKIIGYSTIAAIVLAILFYSIKGAA